ncbi:hypothetical protein Ssi03_29430 [Sphaerisporangium siamense]|uniref:WxL domain-containing protein n=1 Tax=Sphaerisporangium siamense TaxID=795645 RepID=A0A7W7GET1_9ACTN|nr:hypothetical protein [Sphaerisporangium siamense]MBB4704366.1 hypothetical protein [Sphaerisporangium siamense]GII84953.1 hypothetical protein Ssi03_29430 [Sphaerisporangium siamense]
MRRWHGARLMASITLAGALSAPAAPSEAAVPRDHPPRSPAEAREPEPGTSPTGAPATPAGAATPNGHPAVEPVSSPIGPPSPPPLPGSAFPTPPPDTGPAPSPVAPEDPGTPPPHPGDRPRDDASGHDHPARAEPGTGETPRAIRGRRSGARPARRHRSAAPNTLTITVPNSANLGNGYLGGTLSAEMGTVSVEDSRNGSAGWTATVSSTNFTTGAGSAAQTIPRANIAYWSGPVTASSGGGTRTPGQATADQRVSLSTTRTAFRGTKSPLVQITSWQPTLVITIPSSVVSGVYTGTITHQVA